MATKKQATKKQATRGTRKPSAGVVAARWAAIDKGAGTGISITRFAALASAVRGTTVSTKEMGTSEWEPVRLLLTRYVECIRTDHFQLASAKESYRSAVVDAIKAV